MTSLPIGACAMIVAGALLLPSHAGATEFDGMVADLEGATHVHHTHIPLMGLVGFCARMYTHGGVRGLHVATLENVGDKLPQERFGELMASRFGEGWLRMISEQDFDSHEFTLIYTRPAGKQMEMMIASLEQNEIALVSMKLDPKSLQEFVRHSREHHHGQR